eukprot:9432333-Pyramimonas_sp.AAC.1
MAAAPARQHIWPCDLMRTVGETQRVAQQTQQRAAHDLARHAPRAPISQEQAVVAAAAAAALVADHDRVVVERVAVALTHGFAQPLSRQNTLSRAGLSQNGYGFLGHCSATRRGAQGRGRSHGFLEAPCFLEGAGPIYR